MLTNKESREIATRLRVELENIVGVKFVPERTCTFSKHEKICDNYPTCSACGYEADWHECEPYGYSGFEYEKNYCPNCGSMVINNGE